MTRAPGRFRCATFPQGRGRNDRALHTTTPGGGNPPPGASRMADRILWRTAIRRGQGWDPGASGLGARGRIGGRLSTRLTTRSADERGTGLFVFGGAPLWSRLSTPCAKAGSSTMSAGPRIRVCSAIAPRSGRRPRPGSTGATPPAPPRTGRHRAEANAEPTRKNKKESGLNHFPQNPELDPSMEAGTGPHGDGGLGGILLRGCWLGRCAVMEG